MVTVRTALVQEPLDPVMLYTVVAAGDKVLDVPEPEGNQVYVAAPPVFTVTGVPLQIVVLVTDAVTVGRAVTPTQRWYVWKYSCHSYPLAYK